MLAPDQVHIVDSDSKRRAQVAYALSDRGYRAHVYESISEFEQFTPSDGLLLLSGDDDPVSLSDLRERLNARGECVPVAMYASKPEAAKVVEAMLCGAVDYLEWPLRSDAADIIRKATSRAGNQLKLERRRAAALTLMNNLSNREREVLTCMILGLSNKTIAHQLTISPRTVEIHRGNLIRKLNASSSAGAVRLGIYAGLDE